MSQLRTKTVLTLTTFEDLEEGISYEDAKLLSAFVHDEVDRIAHKAALKFSARFKEITHPLLRGDLKIEAKIDSQVIVDEEIEDPR